MESIGKLYRPNHDFAMMPSAGPNNSASLDKDSKTHDALKSEVLHAPMRQNPAPHEFMLEPRQVTRRLLGTTS